MCLVFVSVRTKINNATGKDGQEEIVFGFALIEHRRK